jgi:protein FRA10AC1
MSDKNLHERLMRIHNRMVVIKPTAMIETDHSALQRAHQFIRDLSSEPKTWEEKLAIKYYSRLFREFAIADLSRYKESQVGFRWRLEREVLEGKGQFICGSKGCNTALSLESYEVNFSYVEGGAKKQALVKVKLCADCGSKLNHGRGEKSYKIVRKRERDEDPSHGEENSKAQKILKAAEVLQYALGAESQRGGVERPSKADNDNQKARTDQKSMAQTDTLTADEGMWGQTNEQQIEDSARGLADIDEFLDDLFS